MKHSISDTVQIALGKLGLQRPKEKEPTHTEVLAALSQSDSPDLELVYTLILTELALADNDFDSRENHFIQSKLQEIFCKSPEQISKLIKQSQIRLKPFRGASGYTAYLKEKLSLEKRQQLLSLIDNVIAADNVENGFEVLLRKRYAALLGLSTEE